MKDILEEAEKALEKPQKTTIQRFKRFSRKQKDGNNLEQNENALNGTSANWTARACEFGTGAKR